MTEVTLCVLTLALGKYIRADQTGSKTTLESCSPSSVKPAGTNERIHVFEQISISARNSRANVAHAVSVLASSALCASCCCVQ